MQAEAAVRASQGRQAAQQTGQQAAFGYGQTGPQAAYGAQATAPQAAYQAGYQQTGAQAAYGYGQTGPQTTGPQAAYGYGQGGSQPMGPQEMYWQQMQAQQMQQAQMQQEAARQAREQRRRAEVTAERQRIATETASHGAFRGYNTGAVPPAEKRDAQSPQQKPPRHTAAVVAFVLLALAVLTGGAFAGVSYFRTKQIRDAVRPYDGLFCYGVYVDGIALGGMTPEQAMNSVRSQIQQRNDAWKVELTYDGETVAEINAAMLGMSVDVGQIMNEAWAQGHTGTDEERYAAMQALTETPYEAYTAIPSGDTSVIDGLLANLKAQIEKPAQDAYLIEFDPSLNYPFNFAKEEAGTTLDTDEVRDELYRMVATMQGGSVALTPETVAPSVTVNDLMAHYMLRSSVYTPISTSSPSERNDNIRRALELINGYVLQAGSQFSFNTVVGERTEANGFFPAIEYAYGEHVMGIGGGVCQASTTVYQAAVCAGLTIVTRKPHSDAVNYTEYGKDATVYWNGRRKIDLVFRNNTEEPIYIVAGVQADPSNRKRLIAKVMMYGADMGDVRYELESVVTEELEPPENPEYIKDKNATYVTYTDQQESVSKAQKGYVVDSYRLEYVGNVLTNRVKLYTDTYEPKAERIYVGVTKRETSK